MADYRTLKHGTGYRVSVDFYVLESRVDRITDDVIKFLLEEALKDNGVLHKHGLDPKEIKISKFDRDERIPLGYSFP